ncbi:MAG: biopolymer transporter ExbD [Victivallales bacterium]|nr:biopolymer transporter ExbD [Victivallales bacterium]
MMHWQEKLKPMRCADTRIVLLDLFFILLVVIMVSSNYVFLPGVEGATLPKMPEAEVMRANKLIVTITDEGNYVFNGQEKISKEDLKSTLRDKLNDGSIAAQNRQKLDEPDTPIIVLRAGKRISYETIMDFFAFARSMNADVFLVSEPQKEVAPQVKPDPDED